MILLALLSGLCSVESRPIRADLENRPATPFSHFLSQASLPYFLVSIAQQLLTLLVSTSHFLFLISTFTLLFSASSSSPWSCPPSQFRSDLNSLHTHDIQKIIIEKYPSENPLRHAGTNMAKTHTENHHTAIWPLALSIFLHTVANN